MAGQTGSPNESTNIIDIARKYTNNDLNKAKEMAADQYLDVVVVKGRFIVESKNYSGMILAFFNHINEYISNVTSIISSNTELYNRISVFDNWKSLHHDLMTYKEGPDMVDSQNFNYFLVDSFDAHDVFPDVRDRNLNDLTNTFHEIISKSFNVDSIDCQIEFEATSSLAMDLEGVPINLPFSESGEAAPVPQDDRIARIESEAKYVIEGEAVLAPVRGKNINELIPGDKVKLILPGKDVVTDKILKLLDAYDSEGGRLPIPGRIKIVVPDAGGGFILYAFVAKGVLAKVYEEENVKIMLDKPPVDSPERATKMENWIIYVLAALVGIIILCGIFIFRIL
jgi:hypothetical protein